MNRGLTIGATLGGALVYLLDPRGGRRRRAMLRQRFTRFLNMAADAADATARDMRNRAQGLVAEVRSRFEHEEVNDTVLAERVRARIGRAVRNPSSIEVTAQNGVVTLSGPILAREVRRLLKHVASVRGVRGVENRLEVHERPGDIPGLQGQPRREAEFELFQEHWSPTTRVLVGMTGGALALYGARRRGVLGTAITTAGLGLAARGITNMPFRRLIGIGARRRAIDLQKAITINAPVERVFELWSNFDNFPRFMSNVREVRKVSGNRSHWVVRGPGGMPMEWDAGITAYEPHRVLSWRTLPGAMVENAGTIRFEPVGDATRVDVKLSYNPRAGGIGHMVAALFGVDPKKQMDEDLMRMKTFIETGRLPHDAAAQTA